MLKRRTFSFGSPHLRIYMHELDAWHPCRGFTV